MSEPRCSVGQEVLAVQCAGPWRGPYAVGAVVDSDEAIRRSLCFPAVPDEWWYSADGLGAYLAPERSLRPYDPPSSNTFTELMAKAKRGELEAV